MKNGVTLPVMLITSQSCGFPSTVMYSYNRPRSYRPICVKGLGNGAPKNDTRVRWFCTSYTRCSLTKTCVIACNRLVKRNDNKISGLLVCWLGCQHPHPPTDKNTPDETALCTPSSRSQTAPECQVVKEPRLRQWVRNPPTAQHQGWQTAKPKTNSASCLGVSFAFWRGDIHSAILVRKNANFDNVCPNITPTSLTSAPRRQSVKSTLVS